MEVDGQHGGAPAFDVEVRLGLAASYWRRQGADLLHWQASRGARSPQGCCRRQRCSPLPPLCNPRFRRTQLTTAATPRSTACCLPPTRVLTLP